MSLVPARFLYSGDETEIREIKDLEILFQLFLMFQEYELRGSKDLFIDMINKVGDCKHGCKIVMKYNKL